MTRALTLLLLLGLSATSLAANCTVTRYYGCYADNAATHTLPIPGGTANTLESCASLCLDAGAVGTAGVASGNACWCSQSTAPVGRDIANTSCSQPCANRSPYHCGGEGAISEFSFQCGGGTMYQCVEGRCIISTHGNYTNINVCQANCTRPITTTTPHTTTTTTTSSSYAPPPPPPPPSGPGLIAGIHVNNCTTTISNNTGLIVMDNSSPSNGGSTGPLLWNITEIHTINGSASCLTALNTQNFGLQITTTLSVNWPSATTGPTASVTVQAINSTVWLSSANISNEFAHACICRNVTFYPRYYVNVPPGACSQNTSAPASWLCKVISGQPFVINVTHTDGGYMRTALSVAAHANASTPAPPIPPISTKYYINNPLGTCNSTTWSVCASSFEQGYYSCYTQIAPNMNFFWDCMYAAGRPAFSKQCCPCTDLYRQRYFTYQSAPIACSAV